jgi:hypothetical protein
MDRYICKGAAFEAALPYKAADMYTCKDKSVLKRYLCGEQQQRLRQLAGRCRHG